MKSSFLAKVIIVVLLTTGIFFQCTDKSPDTYQYETLKPVLPEETYNYSKQTLPNDKLKELLASKVNDHGATLGRVLFYDKILSKNNSVSCGSCHHQALGFSDGKVFSTGFDGRTTRRNSMSICNTLEDGVFFWDGRETTIDNLVLQPVKDHVEMGMEKMDILIQKLEKAGYYAPLFNKAFGNSSITPERVSNALAQFVNSMVSTNAKAQQIKGNSWTADLDIPKTFSAQEEAGARLFFGKALCGQCHFRINTELIFFQSQRFADIGLEVSPKDLGQGEINPGSAGIFKVPNLANIALTGPYMHDGRFKTLDEVIDHYSENIKASPNLSFVLRDVNGSPIKLKLTHEEKKSLKAFLHTFTDQQMISDVKFSDPFRH